MPNSQSSGEKSFNVNRSSAGINSITSNQFELTQHIPLKMVNLLEL